MKASEVLDNLKRRFPNEPEYHQAVSEVLGTIEEAYNEHPEFEKSNLIAVSYTHLTLPTTPYV